MSEMWMWEVRLHSFAFVPVAPRNRRMRGLLRWSRSCRLVPEQSRMSRSRSRSRSQIQILQAAVQSPGVQTWSARGPTAAAATAIELRAAGRAAEAVVRQLREEETFFSDRPGEVFPRVVGDHGRADASGGRGGNEG